MPSSWLQGDASRDGRGNRRARFLALARGSRHHDGCVIKVSKSARVILAVLSLRPVSRPVAPRTDAWTPAVRDRTRRPAPTRRLLLASPAGKCSGGDQLAKVRFEPRLAKVRFEPRLPMARAGGFPFAPVLRSDR